MKTLQGGEVFVPARGKQISGVARRMLAAELKEKYDGGASVRALCRETGRSYGFIHRMLLEGGTNLRQRGGTTGRPRKKN